MIVWRCGEQHGVPMDADRLQGLAVPFLLDLSCCSHHEQQQLVLSTGPLKYTGAPCLALRHHVGRRAEQRGGKRSFVRAAVSHDLAAVAVAAATVLPVCWLYVNRSRLLAGFPSTTSTGQEETSATERISSLSPSKTTNGASVAQQFDGKKNKEAHDDVLTNRQSQYNGGLLEEQWRSVNNKHESVMASVASVEDSESRSSDARSSFGVAPTSTITWLEPSVEDTTGDARPDDGGSTAYPEFSRRFFESWNSEMPLANEDEQNINQDRLKSGSMASTPQATHAESVGESDEGVGISVDEIIDERSQNFPRTEENNSGVSGGGNQMENSSDSHSTHSTSDEPPVKVNGTVSRLKPESNVATGDADTVHRGLNGNASLNGSARFTNGVARFSSDDEKAEKKRIEGRGEEEAHSLGDETETRKIEDSVHVSDTVQTVSHPDPSALAGRSSEVVSKKSSVHKVGVNGSVNGQRPMGGVISSSELIAVTDLEKLKTEQRSLSSSRRVPSLSEILPVDSSAGLEFYLDIYKKVLRAARVKDCILLLEEMDKVDLLDTDQIYHGKFFKACQKQKAVKEAFRFMRLLSRPTLSTYNMLLNVCREARDVDGGLRVLSAAEKAGFKPDTILYTTLISTCAKAGKVDIAFKVFHDMQSAGVVATIETFGAMIDGCALAGQIAKAFGVYGIMISKKLKPDLIIFNTLIKACGRVGAIERAFDVLADMRAEPFFLTPNHVTMGALISACARVGQVDRAFEVYSNMRKWRIKGTAECYTAAVHACSSGNLDLAFSVFEDLKQDGVRPDEIFFSALIDVAGHSKQIDAAFRIVDDMRKVGVIPAATTYSALMGVCCNTGSWERGLQLYNKLKSTSFLPTISTFNALITALCDAKRIDQSFAVFQEMREAGVKADQITYSILLDACEKLDEPERAFDLYTKGRAEGVIPNEAMCSSVIGICYARIRKRQSLASYPCSIGLLSGQSNEAPYERWTSWAVAVFRHAVAANVVPTVKCVSLLLGCLRIPEYQHEKNLFEDSLAHPGYSRLRPALAVEGAGIYDPRALVLLEEAASMGVVPHLNYTAGPVTVNAKSIPSYVAEVYVLSLLKGLRRRHMEGAQLFPVTILFSTETKQKSTATDDSKKIRVSGRTGREVAALLRRLRLHFHGHESSGKLRIDTSSIRKWLKPTVTYSPLQRYQEPGILGPAHTFVAQGIAEQQRAIRMGQVFRKPADIGRVPGDTSASSDKYKAPGKRAQANPWDHGETNDFKLTDRLNGVRQSSPGKISRLI